MSQIHHAWEMSLVRFSCFFIWCSIILLFKLWTVFIESFEVTVSAGTTYIMPLVDKFRKNWATTFWCHSGKSLMILFDETFKTLMQVLIVFLLIKHHFLLLLILANICWTYIRCYYHCLTIVSSRSSFNIANSTYVVKQVAVIVLWDVVIYVFCSFNTSLKFSLICCFMFFITNIILRGCKAIDTLWVSLILNTHCLTCKV